MKENEKNDIKRFSPFSPKSSEEIRDYSHVTPEDC